MRALSTGWLALIVVALCVNRSVSADVELIGTGRVDGNAVDRSGQSDALVNGTPHHRFGGISALEYSGQTNRYYALADRGPDDGATGYQCRLHELRIEPAGDNSSSLDISVVATTLLTDSSNRPFVGDARDFTATDASAGRFDPEGIRRFGTDSLLISDEYGPRLIEFSPAGRERRRLALPPHFAVRHPADSKAGENRLNSTGRASNKGMEGLAVSPDGRFVFGLMQAALLQDSHRDKKQKPTGRHCRLMKLDVDNGDVQEYVYRLDSADNGLNEILALNGHEFLVIERDGEEGDEAAFKRILRVDISQATPIDGSQPLPPEKLPPHIKPVDKSVFIDLLDSRYGLAGPSMPGKLEGLSHGPRLADGRRTLVVASDNDFEADAPTLIWRFAY